jgi:hypothetical protein
VFGTVGLSTFFLLPLLAGAGMVVMGAGTVLAPTALLLVPFMLVRI